MTWQPNYRRDLKWRLTAAADCAREQPCSRRQLQHALGIISAFASEQFPADFRTQFDEVMDLAHSVEEMSDETVAATARKIIELQLDVLG